MKNGFAAFLVIIIFVLAVVYAVWVLRNPDFTLWQKLMLLGR